MSKIKVSTLTGPQLNDQVALALGWQQRLWGAIPVWFDPANENRYRCHVAQWNPSTDPAQAYPIIERERIMTYPSRGGDWLSRRHYNETYDQRGATALIAAMRCFVASKFGEGVDEGKNIGKI